jgi:hypothetical protein
LLMLSTMNIWLHCYNQTDRETKSCVFTIENVKRVYMYILFLMKPSVETTFELCPTFGFGSLMNVTWQSRCTRWYRNLF